MNKKQFNKIVDNYSDSLYRFILKSCNNDDLSKDIVQDSFEKLWLKIENIEFKNAKSYLFTTAYHTLIDYFRKNKKQTDFDFVNEAKLSHQNQYSDLQELLHQAINLLPSKQRIVVLLRDYEGYSYEEIAEITKLSLAQVKTYIYRARVFLKNYIVSIETVI